MIVIEDVNEKGTDWFLSFTNPNPEVGDFIEITEEQAYKFMEQLVKRPHLKYDDLPLPRADDIIFWRKGKIEYMDGVPAPGEQLNKGDMPPCRYEAGKNE